MTRFKRANQLISKCARARVPKPSSYQQFFFLSQFFFLIIWNEQIQCSQMHAMPTPRLKQYITAKLLSSIIILFKLLVFCSLSLLCVCVMQCKQNTKWACVCECRYSCCCCIISIFFRRRRRCVFSLSLLICNFILEFHKFIMFLFFVSFVRLCSFSLCALARRKTKTTACSLETRTKKTKAQVVS